MTELGEVREDLREFRADLKILDGRVDKDDAALIGLRGEVALLTAAVSAMSKQQAELLEEGKQLRAAIDGLRADVAKAHEMAANPIATISARAKAAGGIGGGSLLFGVVYAYGKSKGWWE